MVKGVPLGEERVRVDKDTGGSERVDGIVTQEGGQLDWRPWHGQVMALLSFVAENDL